MYHMPIYLLISTNFQSLMILLATPMVFKTKKHSFIKFVIAFIIYFVFNYLATAYDNKISGYTNWIVFFFHALFFLFLFVLTDSSFLEKIIFCFYNYIICLLSGFIEYSIFFKTNVNVNIEKPIISFVLSFITALIYFIFIGIYCCIKKQDKTSIINLKSFALFSAPNILWQYIFFLSCISKDLMHYKLSNTKETFSNAQNNYIFGNYYIISIIIVLLIYILYFLININKFSYLEKLEEKTNVSKKNILLQQEQARRLYEKAINIKTSLNEMLNQYKNTAELSKEQINSAVNNFNQITINNYSDNCLIEAILNEKLSTLPENTDIKTNVTLPQEIFINDFDLCRVFCNTLDNSIEAIKNSENKFINIYSSCIDDKFTLLIENSFGTKKYSSKKHYGLGLIILNDICKKYNGKLTTKIKKRTFQTLIELSATNI